MSEPDASGRQKVVINEGSEYLEDADVVYDKEWIFKYTDVLSEYL